MGKEASRRKDDWTEPHPMDGRKILESREKNKK
jgi:hypothetical protein